MLLTNEFGKLFLGVAVGQRSRCGFGADDSARPGPVLDHNRLPEHGRDFFRNDSCRDVGRLSRRPGDDQFDRTVRVALRSRRAGSEKCKQS